MSTLHSLLSVYFLFSLFVLYFKELLDLASFWRDRVTHSKYDFDFSKCSKFLSITFTERNVIKPLSKKSVMWRSKIVPSKRVCYWCLSVARKTKCENKEGRKLCFLFLTFWAEWCRWIFARILGYPNALLRPYRKQQKTNKWLPLESGRFVSCRNYSSISY